MLDVVRTTLADARQVPGLLRFLVGRFFYTDPINTVIAVMAVFATQAIGFTDVESWGKRTDFVIFAKKP